MTDLSGNLQRARLGIKGREYFSINVKAPVLCHVAPCLNFAFESTTIPKDPSSNYHLSSVSGGVIPSSYKSS